MNVVKVVNVFNADPDEKNSGFVPLRQDVAIGVHLEDKYGHYAVAEAMALPNRKIARGPDDSRVFDRQDLID